MPAITVKGMRCEHCRKSVAEAVAKVPGVASVDIDLEKAEARWTDGNPAAPADPAAVKDAVNAIGFEAQ